MLFEQRRKLLEANPNCHMILTCGIEEGGKLVGQDATRNQLRGSILQGMTTISHDEACRALSQYTPTKRTNIVEHPYNSIKSPKRPVTFIKKLYDDPFDGPHPALDKHREETGKYDSEWDVGLDSEDVDSLSSFSDD